MIPLLFETGNVLTIWLGNYPHYAVEFCVLTLMASYVEAISAPLWMMIYAQTNIKRYQISISLVYSLNFIGGWIALALGAVPYSVIIVRVCVFAVLAYIRLVYVKKFFLGFDMKKWAYQVVGKNLVIVVLSCVGTGVVAYTLKSQVFLHVFAVTCFSLCITIPLIYRLGLDLNERKFVANKLAHIYKRHRTVC